MHQEPLWVGNNAVDTYPWSRTSTLKMEAARPPKRWFPTTNVHGAYNPENQDFFNAVCLFKPSYFICVVMFIAQLVATVQHVPVSLVEWHVHEDQATLDFSCTWLHSYEPRTFTWLRSAKFFFHCFSCPITFVWMWTLVIETKCHKKTKDSRDEIHETHNKI
jgi:hypothetical protein